MRGIGAMDEGRNDDMALALRVVTSTAGVTADAYPYDMAVLAHIANRVVNEVRGISRVTYDVTSKPLGTTH